MFSVFGTHRSGVGNWEFDPGRCVPGGLLSPGLKSSFSDSITGQSKSFINHLYSENQFLTVFSMRY